MSSFSTRHSGLSMLSASSTAIVEGYLQPTVSTFCLVYSLTSCLMAPVAFVICVQSRFAMACPSKELTRHESKWYRRKPTLQPFHYDPIWPVQNIKQQWRMNCQIECLTSKSKLSSKLAVLQEAFPCSVLACKGVHFQQEDHFPPQVDGALGSWRAEVFHTAISWITQGDISYDWKYCAWAHLW